MRTAERRRAIATSVYAYYVRLIRPVSRKEVGTARRLRVSTPLRRRGVYPWECFQFKDELVGSIDDAGNFGKRYGFMSTQWHKRIRLRPLVHAHHRPFSAGE